MKKSIENITTDFRRVFVEGNATNYQMLIVYLALALPSAIALLVFNGIIK